MDSTSTKIMRAADREMDVSAKKTHLSPLLLGPIFSTYALKYYSQSKADKRTPIQTGHVFDNAFSSNDPTTLFYEQSAGLFGSCSYVSPGTGRKTLLQPTVCGHKYEYGHSEYYSTRMFLIPIHLTKG